jgi:hypothetical protein
LVPPFFSARTTSAARHLTAAHECGTAQVHNPATSATSATPANAANAADPPALKNA